MRGTSHPQGVQPSGNALFMHSGDCRQGMGLFQNMDDEQVLRLMSHFDARILAHISITCKALYCFGNHEELWKALTLEHFHGNFQYKGSWRATYLRISKLDPAAREASALTVTNMFSDLLYQPFHCSNIHIQSEWVEIENVERHSDLTVEDFQERFERLRKPVIITDVVSKWPAYKSWNVKSFQKHFNHETVTVGDMQMKFSDFLAYSKSNHDEMPLYLFDKHFAKKVPKLAQDYQVPDYFAEDLFSVLGEDKRPDYRWLIMGGKRSGSSFHKDPNCTSAWNAVISGAKKWILYPPHILPPGVEASEDGSEVATSVSLIEWFLNFYEETREAAYGAQPFECVVNAGEVIFIPHGWWHLVLNLEEGIAITQNYVSSVNLPQVLKVLATKSESLISGCPVQQRKHLYEDFTRNLREQKPEVLEKRASKRKANEIASCFQQTDTGFKFSFG